MHADVFRFPAHPNLFAAVIGSGTQILVMTFVIFGLALVRLHRSIKFAIICQSAPFSFTTGPSSHPCCSHPGVLARSAARLHCNTRLYAFQTRATCCMTCCELPGWRLLPVQPRRPAGVLRVPVRHHCRYTRQSNADCAVGHIVYWPCCVMCQMLDMCIGLRFCFSTCHRPDAVLRASNIAPHEWSLDLLWSAGHRLACAASLDSAPYI